MRGYFSLYGSRKWANSRLGKPHTMGGDTCSPTKDNELRTRYSCLRGFRPGFRCEFILHYTSA